MAGFWERLTRFFRLGRGRRAAGGEPGSGPADAHAPRAAVNDAASYGVAVEPATARGGEWYWQAILVHHLSPKENQGDHRLFLDVIQPGAAGRRGRKDERVQGARLKITWENGAEIVEVDQPPERAGTHFPLWKTQVYAVQAMGVPGSELPSERVTGIHMNHPDEGSGNHQLRHSFSVVFCKVQAPAVAYRESVIEGIIRDGGGRRAVLLRGGEQVASQTIPADGSIFFEHLAAGEYVVTVDGSRLRSEMLALDGQNQAQVDLALVLGESTVSGRVLHGAGRRVRLSWDGAEMGSTIVGAGETYSFTGLVAGTYRVEVEGLPLRSDPLLLNGRNTVQADLVAPAKDKMLEHYVLFGPAEHPATRANLLLAQDFLLMFGPTFGFNAGEAASARLVTIVSDPLGVSPETEAELAAGGALVHRIQGDVDEVVDAFSHRIAGGQPFA